MQEPTIPDQITKLESNARWWEAKCKQLEERIEEIEGRKEDAEEQRREREEAADRAATADLRRARAAAIRALIKLLPEAVKQAKAKPPKPALLRMILRATR